MKKIYFMLIALLAISNMQAQCVIDSVMIDTVSGGGLYPDAPHLPAVVKDSLYDQTVQGKIQSSMTLSIAGFTGTVTVDSVRLDSIEGLPTGITWVKNPNVLKGGGYGCIEFTGTTNDTAGTYNINAIGMIWVHLSFPPLVDEDTSTYGSLNRIAPFQRYYLVVDSTPLPLSATALGRNLCAGVTSTTATVTAIGGSPISPYTYLWSTGSTSYTTNLVDTGTYFVTVASGIDTTIDTVVILADPSALNLLTTDSGSTGNNGSATVSVSGGTPPYTYRWTNGATTDSIDSLRPGTYFVTVRDSFGCTYRDSAVVANLATGINSTTLTSAKLNLYPNPANNSINVVIESQQAITGQIQIMDITGRTVYATPVAINGHYVLPINLTNFSSGVYVLQLSSDKQSTHQRFEVAH